MYASHQLISLFLSSLPGIPKFYRWLSERYPLINQPGGATVVPIIDNFYLDMNGIIHNCTHGNNPDVKLTEDEMILRIFTYLDKLFHIVKPQKLMFMAIDGKTYHKITLKKLQSSGQEKNALKSSLFPFFLPFISFTSFLFPFSGVAPRAKMNQQRSRRFKTARESQAAFDAAISRGEPLPDEATRFDSNCITPGTPFMARLGNHLRFFIRKKLAEDPAWQKPTIIFSGHDVPGEGEHKIMEYIRWGKRSATWVPNTRHCLYGLDADLIMLSLVTHEPHFCLLREVVSFSGGNRGQPAREVLENPCQEHFVLLQIGLLRDYVNMEFKGALEGKIPFDYDLERIIDDLVLFCMLVGNDFLPALPTMDIAEGSLDDLISFYKELLPVMGGYLTYAGELHRGRLEMLLSRLAGMEADILAQRAEDTEEFEANMAKKKNKGKEPMWTGTGTGGGGTTGGNGGGKTGTGLPAFFSAGINGSTAKKNGVLSENPLALLSLDDDEEEEEAAAAAAAVDDDPQFAAQLAKFEETHLPGHELELLAVVEGEALEEERVSATTVSQEPTMMSKEARNMFLMGDKQAGLAAWKKRYYADKLKTTTDGDRRRVTESYIQGLHWVLEYYYRGVASWNWFYPYHYAPMASELVDLPSVPVMFEQGEPFFPYEQLLAVQPSSSANLLPPAYQRLMTEGNSPIADFYPVDFKIDCEGKRADWEGVVLIPFIDEQRLLKASRSINQSFLTAEERSRNVLGDIMVFTHSEGSHEFEYCTSTLPSHYASIIGRSNSRAISQPAPPPLPAGELGFQPKFLPGTKVGATGPPGFPTLKTIQMSGRLERAGINVFGMPSRKESVVLQLKDLGVSPGVEAVAGVLVGQKCWVMWPYLQEAVVEAVSDAEKKCTRAPSSRIEDDAGGKKKRETTKAALTTVMYHTKEEADNWGKKKTRLITEHSSRHGVLLGQVNLLLHVRPLEGLIRQVDGTVEKRFGKKEVLYPLQVTLRRNPSPDPRFQPESVTDALSSLQFKVGSKAVFLGRAYYGCLATILPESASGLTKKGGIVGKKKMKKDGDDGGDGKEEEEEEEGHDITGDAAGEVTSKAKKKKSSSKKEDAALAAVAAKNLRVTIDPAPLNSAQVAAAAKRLLLNIQSTAVPSGAVARRLGVAPRVLGRMTGNVWVKTGEGRGDKVDVGLLVKNAKLGLYVPDFAVAIEYNNNNNNRGGGGGGYPQQGQQQQQQQEQQENTINKGWAYTDAFVRILEQYKSRYGWVWAAIDQDSSAREYTLEQLLPGVDKETALSQVQALKAWMKSQSVSRRPLVRMTSKVAPEPAVRLLQASLPSPTDSASVGSNSLMEPIELENVSPALLLPPTEKGGAGAALAGGSFEVGERVVCIAGTGIPPFGARGTVIGVYEEDGAVEVLFDEEFLGGTDLFGRCSDSRGGLLAAIDLLNLSRPAAIKAQGIHAPRVVAKLPLSSSSPQPLPLNKQKSAPSVAAVVSGQAMVPAAMKGQPKIPDGPGAKGFHSQTVGGIGTGRGRGTPVKSSPSLPFSSAATPTGTPEPRAPGSKPRSTAPGDAGKALLAQLQGAGGKATAALQQQTPPPPPPPPPSAAPQYHYPPHPMSPYGPGPGGVMMMYPYPPPPPHYMPPPPPGMGPPPPPGPPHMMMMYPPPPPGMMMPGMPMPPPGHAPPPPPAGGGAGAALLSQLQKGAGTTAAATSGGSGNEGKKTDAGSELLNALKKAGEGKKIAATTNDNNSSSEPAPPPVAPSSSLLNGGDDGEEKKKGGEKKKSTSTFWKNLKGGGSKK